MPGAGGIMTRLRALSALTVLALAAPAAAQPTTRDHRSPPPPPAQTRPNESVAIRMEVTSWGPKTARPGTLVTLEGGTFARSLKVLVGGRPVAATIASGKISFKVPATAGDGE